MASRTKAYSRLKSDTAGEEGEEADAFSHFPPLKPAEVDPRFVSRMPKKTPWKAICHAVFLLTLGTSMYVVALLVHLGHIHPDKVSKWGFVGLGSLVFLPGFYCSRIAYYTWRGAKGYSFDAIPQW
eukprot:CAMPEP_0197490342 /NCGR_PEP_ID=MMETSP1311-20131121/4914_1 /TAXON_ID=464262 /ORGANISM="Genus nov. species nov., Strain RCC856" /LENGTH=125 /DNA_ID=CAMNT_0043034849 /DNA_START=66 /DNA_END=443 /DNA_ORIENTATION=-